MSTTIKKSFFPKSKRFWFLHLGCWLCVYLFIVFVQILFGSGGVKMQAVGGMIYVGLGAIGGLVYRYLFNAFGWLNYSIGRLTLLSAIFVGVCGAIVGLLIVVYLYLLNLAAPDWATELQTKMQHKKFLILVFIYNAVNIAVFQSIWSAVYIAIANYRRSIKREVEQLKLENSLKEAKLNILSSQLNPHFLFNALNNIRFMMRKNVSEAEDMLTHLSELLRYALESSREEKVSLERELETVENYISLTQVQFNKRLNFLQQIDTPTLHYLLPPMMLQMLIENAVKHGMEQLKDGGELHLIVKLSKGKLNIEVCNEYVQGRRAEKKEGFSIGLTNIEKRLQLLYGDAASMKARSDSHYWTSILSIPAEVVSQ